MKKSVITVDDEGPALRRINKLINEDPRLELLASANSAKQALNLLRSQSADILFLDIQLKDATSFDVLNQLKKPFPGRIVFVTAYDEYAVKAFEIGAIDYLLKPFNKERLERCIRRIESSDASQNIMQILSVIHSAGEVLKVPEGKRTHFFNSNAIEFIQSETYYSRFTFQDGTQKLLRITLKEVGQILPANFQRINKSTILNLNRVIATRELKGGVELDLGDGRVFKSSSRFLGQ